MAYSSQTDILKRMPEAELISLTDHEQTGAVVAAVVTEAIAAADSEIDSYLRARGEDTPLEDVPEIVVRVSVALAINSLYEDRVESVPETVASRRDWARAWLTDFAAGRVSLGDDDHSATDPATDTIVYDTADRVFTRDDMEDW